MTPIKLEIKGVQQEAVDNIKLLLESVDADIPVTLEFTAGTGYQSYTAAIQLYELIVKRPDTTAIAFESLIGPQLLPFVGCINRWISCDTEIAMQPPAYLSHVAKSQLVEHIEKHFGPTDGYCHAFEYERLSVILFETASRMQVLEAQQIVILSNHTEIPESFYSETLPNGYEVSADEAMTWKIATDIVTVS